ncbi:hypothetical protein WAI453_001760 [Rhynchosporium graminicola]
MTYLAYMLLWFGLPISLPSYKKHDFIAKAIARHSGIRDLSEITVLGEKVLSAIEKDSKQGKIVCTTQQTMLHQMPNRGWLFTKHLTPPKERFQIPDQARFHRQDRVHHPADDAAPDSRVQRLLEEVSEKVDEVAQGSGGVCVQAALFNTLNIYCDTIASSVYLREV